MTTLYQETSELDPYLAETQTGSGMELVRLRSSFVLDPNLPVSQKGFDKGPVELQLFFLQAPRLVVLRICFWKKLVPLK